ARLRPDPAVEPQGRDHPTDPPHRCRRRQVHGADPRGRGQRPEGTAVMKVVLFGGGLGAGMREYSGTIPKPMIPVGHQPILWHVMQYYSEYGHTDFILTLGYKASIIKEFFLSYRPQVYADCVVSGFGSHVELLSEPEEDWRITLIDTG